MTRLNPMILVSLVVAMLLLVAVIYFSMLVPANTTKPIKLVTGEWAPYSGEHIADKGISTAIVTQVFELIGYSPQYLFEPWQIGQARVALSQKNDGVRGIFPYMKTPSREAEFYFSDSIIRMKYGAFYHKDNNPQANLIIHTDDLAHHQIVAIVGYEYHPEFSQHMLKETCTKKDTNEGFDFLRNPKPMALLINDVINLSSLAGIKSEKYKALATQILPSLVRYPLTLSSGRQSRKVSNQQYSVYYSKEATKTKYDGSLDSLRQFDVVAIRNQLSSVVASEIGLDICTVNTLGSALALLGNSVKPPLLIESVDVGEQLLAKQFPHISHQFARAKIDVYADMAVMFSRANPDNLALKNRFNSGLAQLKSNPSAYNALISKVKNRIDMANAILLVPFGENEWVSAFAFDASNQTCITEQSIYLPGGSKALVKLWDKAFFTYSQPADYTPLVRIKLLNGPLAAASEAQYLCVDGRSIVLQ